MKSFDEKIPGVLVGAKINPDGSLDTSKALVMDDSDSQSFRQNAKKLHEEDAQRVKSKREKSLRTPEGLKPKTLGAYIHRMHVAITLAREAVEKGDVEKKKILDQLEQELSLICENGITEQLSAADTDKDDEVVEKRYQYQNLSAMTAHDVVQYWYIDRFEEDKIDVDHEQRKVVERLLSKLLDEASRDSI